MARPLKIGLDYFPLDVDFLGNLKVRKIMRAHGANSISILICLLGNIYKDKGYYIRWDEDMTFLIADAVGVSEGAVIEVVTKAVNVDFFSKTLFESHKILTSEGIQQRYLSATCKRGESSIIADFRVFDVDNPVIDGNNPVIDGESTQSKVKKIKVNNIPLKSPKGESLIFTPPSVDQVAEYVLEQNYEVDPRQWHDFYQSKGWMVGRNKMRDWRAAVRTWQRSKTQEQQPKTKQKLCL